VLGRLSASQKLYNLLGNSNVTKNFCSHLDDFSRQESFSLEAERDSLVTELRQTALDQSTSRPHAVNLTPFDLELETVVFHLNQV
jgi:hypothetical protein